MPSAGSTSYNRTSGSFRQIHIDEYGVYAGLGLPRKINARSKKQEARSTKARMDTYSCPVWQTFISGNY
jgi:hypothetical protein